MRTFIFFTFILVFRPTIELSGFVMMVEVNNIMQMISFREITALSIFITSLHIYRRNIIVSVTFSVSLFKAEIHKQTSGWIYK